MNWLIVELTESWSTETYLLVVPSLLIVGLSIASAVQAICRVLSVELMEQEVNVSRTTWASAMDALSLEGEYWLGIAKVFGGLLAVQPLLLAILGFSVDTLDFNRIEPVAVLLLAVAATLIFLLPLLIAVTRIGGRRVGMPADEMDYKLASNALRRSIVVCHAIVAISCVALLSLLAVGADAAREVDELPQLVGKSVSQVDAELEDLKNGSVVTYFSKGEGCLASEEVVVRQRPESGDTVGSNGQIWLLTACPSPPSK